jgi:cyclase
MTRLRILFASLLFALVASSFTGVSARAQGVQYLPGAGPDVSPKDSVFIPQVHQLAKGVYAAKLGYVWAGWAELPDGILVIDAGMADSVGRAFADTIRARSPGQPLRYLLLTHAHGDHILGAKPFLEAGVTRIAQASVMGQIDSVLGIAPDPKKEIRITKSKRLGNAARPVDIVWLGRSADSRGDLVVHLPKQRVLFTGDLVSYKSVPWLMDRDFSLKGWLTSLDSLSTKRFDADSLVPGHGVIGKRLEAITFTRRYLRDADEKASRTASWGTTPLEVKRWGYLGAYEGMEFYDEVHFLNMRRLYNEAKGIKTPGRGRVNVHQK